MDRNAARGIPHIPCQIMLLLASQNESLGLLGRFHFIMEDRQPEIGYEAPGSVK